MRRDRADMFKMCFVVVKESSLFRLFWAQLGSYSSKLDSYFPLRIDVDRSCRLLCSSYLAWSTLTITWTTWSCDFLIFSPTVYGAGAHSQCSCFQKRCYKICFIFYLTIRSVGAIVQKLHEILLVFTFLWGWLYWISKFSTRWLCPILSWKSSLATS
jgi:hypothetical protein